MEAETKSETNFENDSGKSMAAALFAALKGCMKGKSRMNENKAGYESFNEIASEQGIKLD